jgi:hypothetical protein
MHNEIRVIEKKYVIKQALMFMQHHDTCLPYEGINIARSRDNLFKVLSPMPTSECSTFLHEIAGDLILFVSVGGSNTCWVSAAFDNHIFAF